MNLRAFPALGGVNLWLVLMIPTETKGGKMLKKFLCTTIFVLCLVQSGISEGIETDTIKLYWMEEIVVTATRTERAVKDLSATVSVITREDIENSNAKSCTDILNTLPGLFVQKTGAFGRADVDIRGIGDGGRRIMVLVDGRPVKMGLFGCTVTHSLPLDNVESIEVVRGPLSVLYGSDALGGVINIITKKPTEPEEIDYTISYGTHNTYEHRLRGGGRRGHLNFYATADKQQSNGHLLNSAYDGRDFTAQTGYALTDNLTLVIGGKYFEGYKEEPLRATDPDTLVSETWNNYERGAVDLTLAGKWRRWDSFLKAYRNFGEHNLSDGWHSRDFTNGAVLNGSGRLFTDNELTLGVEFRQQGGKKLSEPEGEWEKAEYALFLHDEQNFFRRLTLTFGGRYNRDEVSGGEFCPQAGAVLNLQKGTILRCSVNKGFRSPQLNELYMFPPSDSTLEPERVWNYEAGVNQQLVEGVNIDLVGYIIKGEHLIQKEENPEPPPMYKFRNTGEFEFKGLEAGIRTRIMRGLTGQLYYTYLDPGEKTTGRPGNKLDLHLMYARNRGGLSFSCQYVTNYFAADNREEPIDDYFIVYTKLSYKILDALRAFLAVDNMLNREYEIYADLPGGGAGIYTMPKRTFTVGLNYKF